MWRVPSLFPQPSETFQFFEQTVYRSHWVALIIGLLIAKDRTQLSSETLKIGLQFDAISHGWVQGQTVKRPRIRYRPILSLGMRLDLSDDSLAIWKTQ